MSAELSRRVAKIINYLSVNNLIPGGSREAFAKRIDIAIDFDSLSDDDKYIIIKSENELFGKHTQKHNRRGKCKRGTYDDTNACGPVAESNDSDDSDIKISNEKDNTNIPKNKSDNVNSKKSDKRSYETKDIISLKDVTTRNDLDTFINNSRLNTFKLPEVQEAILQTDGAKITDNGLELNVVRYQEPEQAGSIAIRGAVFYLPEKNSPYKKYYSGRKNRYGGTERFEGKTIYRNPLIIKGATGGVVPERAYAMIEGKKKLKEMQNDILKVVAPPGYRFTDPGKDHIDEVAQVLEKYGGDRGYAYDIVDATKEGGNLERYAIQEHIIAAAVRKAGYDSVIGFTKMKGKMHLSEVLDVRTNENPFEDSWENDYSEYYDDLYEDIKDNKLKDNSMYVEPVDNTNAVKLNYKCKKGDKNPDTNECPEKYNVDNEKRPEFPRRKNVDDLGKLSKHDTNKKSINGVKPSWQGIAHEASKYDSFEKYENDWIRHNMFGKYWHITDDPNFKIDPEKGPRDMSSMASGKMSKGELMVSSIPEHWIDQYPDRKYIAEIDLTDVPKEKYYPVQRGFGQEVNIEDPSKAKVVKVYPIKEGMRAYERYFKKLPQSREELKDIWEKAHNTKNVVKENMLGNLDDIAQDLFDRLLATI